MKCLLLVLLVFSCNSTPERVTPALKDASDTVKESSLSMPEKRVINNAISQCQAQTKYVEELEEALARCNTLSKNLSEQLTEVSRDAGYKDMFHFLLYGAIGLIILGIIGYVLRLVGQGKIRIPFLLG